MIFSVNKTPKSKGVLPNMFFNSAESKELMAISDLALIQMQWYVGIASQINPNMEDTQLAKLMGKSLKTVEKTRLALQNAGWFLRIKSKYKGEQQLTYLVGKKAVSTKSIAVFDRKETLPKE